MNKKVVLVDEETYEALKQENRKLKREVEELTSELSQSTVKNLNISFDAHLIEEYALLKYERFGKCGCIRINFSDSGYIDGFPLEELAKVENELFNKLDNAFKTYANDNIKILKDDIKIKDDYISQLEKLIDEHNAKCGLLGKKIETFW